MIFNRIVGALLPVTPRPLVKVVARKYIAGETVDAAMKSVAELNALGVHGTVDALGEFVKAREVARGETEQSLRVIEEISSRNLNTGLSIKLTSLGLDIDSAFCRENLLEILRLAEQKGVFVRFDMENSPYTDATLDFGLEMWERFPGRVGVVLQAYMRRTLSDVDRLAPSGISFRLCKGIYNESEEIAFKGREEIQQNYRAALRKMLDAGCYVGIATHDEELIESARDEIAQRGLQNDQYEFQMLLGVREARRGTLVSEGHRMRVYVPFGEDWYGYSIRRLKENPAVAGHVVKAFFGIGR